MRKLLTRSIAAGALGVLALLAGAAHAQGVFKQPIRWIVPYPPGGGTDVVARLLAGPMGAALGTTIVVENKPGAGTMIGGETIVRSRPDGSTIGTVDTSTVSLAQHLYPKMAYDPAKDFTYIGGTTRFPFVLLVHPSLPVKNLQELIALARRKPGELRYATPGLGGPNHLGMELFQREAGIELTHVPYKGDAPALQDLIGGQLEMYLVNTAASLGHIKSGKLRPIALSMANRSAVLPGVPTFAESGLPGFESYSWQGLAAPAGMSKENVTRFNSELNKALALPDVRKKLDDLGIEASPTTPEAFAEHVRSQSELWGNVIRKANIRLE